LIPQSDYPVYIFTTPAVIDATFADRTGPLQHVSKEMGFNRHYNELFDYGDSEITTTRIIINAVFSMC